MKYFTPFTALLFCLTIYAQEHSHKSARALSFPDIPGYMTLTTDLHQHTVFSDGSVWPDIRVQEALRDNLDVISLTEHIEYQPHLEDIPHPDRNRSYEIARNEAKNHDLMIIHGTEITREAPMGHSNAIFINDVNKILLDDPAEQFSAAQKQGAFVFWNHPNWYRQSSTGNPIWSDFQESLVENNELHGIEVINEGLYDEESLALALEHNLTIMGTSDVHGLIDWDYIEKGHTRPTTLVFAKERSEESLKEALFNGRTVAVFNELFVGKAEYLIPLIKSCISVSDVRYLANTQILELTLKNNSSNTLLFENAMPYSFYGHSPVLAIKGGETKLLKIKTLERHTELVLRLDAVGSYTAPKTHPTIAWKILVPN